MLVSWILPVITSRHVQRTDANAIDTRMLRQRMCMHDDMQGWDLEVGVNLLGGSVNLVTYEGAMRQRKEKPGVKFIDGFHDLVLFDGVCNLCNATVDFLLQRDADKRLVFCAQQSPEAQAALELYRRRGANSDGGTTEKLLRPAAQGGGDSVLVLGADGVLRDKSNAALRAGEALGGGWRVMSVAARVVLPVQIRDFVYDWIGRNRYRWFGRKDTCRMPTEEEQRSFL